ncbi:MAG TPA: DNA-directed RNA polymerase subunit K [Candidatus Acidoferrum sp.]|jgi:DNA-directed RNA polymerase subunit K/omega|nr:DNA-directed RNA polymerase subunit K [Candidatus Acidoferrum sp.]
MVQKKKEKASSKRSSLTLIGPKKLTRFERARIVGARALQISMGAPVLLDLSESTMSPIQIGELELQEGVLPISIRRSLPDGTSMNIPLKTLLEGERQEAAV